MADTLELKDIERLSKQGTKIASSVGEGNVTKKENPLEGITQKQRLRNARVRDILNIGSGTRCQNCGLLHFCWVENCSSCNKPMNFNLGDRDDKNRL